MLYHVAILCILLAILISLLCADLAEHARAQEAELQLAERIASLDAALGDISGATFVLRRAVHEQDVANQCAATLLGTLTRQPLSPSDLNLRELDKAIQAFHRLAQQAQPAYPIERTSEPL